MTISGRMLGDGQSIMLTSPDGNGAYFIPAENILEWGWDLSMSADIENVTSYGDPGIERRDSLRMISGTISFAATGCQFFEKPIDPNEPIIKEYSVSDMLKMVRAKLESRK